MCISLDIVMYVVTWLSFASATYVLQKIAMQVSTYVRNYD